MHGSSDSQATQRRVSSNSSSFMNWRGVANKMAGKISRSSTSSDVIKHLVDHACPNIIERIDFKSCTPWPVGGGGFGDIYRGKLSDGTDIALKCSRRFIEPSDEPDKTLKHAARELYVWSKLEHKNVVRLLGLTMFRGEIAMVSPWMKHGSLPTYLTNEPSADRCLISAQITEGLIYLHSTGTVHGDLKGLNVLVAEDGTPQLTDFGNVLLEHYSLQFTTTGPKSNHSTRWTAPELLLGTGIYSTKADVYALGMTILETITNKPPYAGKPEPTVMGLVMFQKELPPRPLDLIPKGSEHGDALWATLTQCWSHDPESRPSAAAIGHMIKNITQMGLKGLA
ncbi:kinase-like protein [Ceratobasidium sp. AG-I]|nr:kinase-like protein [Ceratobasidium sp. AG-I]